jgi:hypothetical protein
MTEFKQICKGTNCTATAPDFNHSAECLAEHERATRYTEADKVTDDFNILLKKVLIGLEQLACLGNGDIHGNSTGNVMAISLMQIIQDNNLEQTSTNSTKVFGYVVENNVPEEAYKWEFHPISHGLNFYKDNALQIIPVYKND